MMIEVQPTSISVKKSFGFENSSNQISRFILAMVWTGERTRVALRRAGKHSDHVGSPMRCIRSMHNSPREDLGSKPIISTGQRDISVALSSTCRRVSKLSTALDEAIAQLRPSGESLILKVSH